MKEELLYLGIDIGGAHLKVVGVNQNNQVVLVKYSSCKIWESVENLNNEFEKINIITKSKKTIVAITMTAELCDNFKSREDGVKKLIKKCNQLNHDKFYYIMNQKIFSKKPKFTEIMSMNWHAIGKFLEKKITNTIAIDIGSTTTDFLIIKNNKLLNLFYDDYSRLNNDELIYTGLIRTPLFGVADTISINNKKLKIVPEFFSNMSDIYRVLRELDKTYDIDDTADGQNKSLKNSLKRISRSFGFDYDKKKIDELIRICIQIKEIQLSKIYSTLIKNMRKHALIDVPVVISGIGQDVLNNFLIRRGVKTIILRELLVASKLNKQASYHAPALSIALLLKTLKC